MLSEREVDEALAALPGWQRVERTISRSYRFPSFKDAMFFVNGVAALAEREDHHPDIAIHYTAVTLSLWTHTAGGVTHKDLALARKIEELTARARAA